MTSMIDELCYVVFDTDNIEAWGRFATNILGFETIADSGAIKLRMDSRSFRYIIRQGLSSSLPVVGWQTADAASVDVLASRLAVEEIASDPLDTAELATRQVAGGIRFRCHNGIHHEVVFGPLHLGAFAQVGDVSGFRTAAGGMGHIVWSIPDVAAMDRLMLDIFGMALREDISTPVGQGHFYGCNPRHHSLAVFSAPQLSLEHVMVEMNDIDDVGRAMDRARDLDYDIIQPLGRHRTDHMLSFYVRTPGGFGMEIGCDGVLCGDNWSEIRSSSRRRPWGHGAAMHTHRKKFSAVSPP